MTETATIRQTVDKSALSAYKFINHVKTWEILVIRVSYVFLRFYAV